MRHARELGWLETSVGVLAPTHRTVISVSGDDAHEWLQGQITNQCEGAEPGDSVYGFILTLKGRVMADAWAYFHEGGIWLEVPREATEALIERLDRYIIMEDVDLEHASDLRVLTAQGPKSGDIAGERAWPCDRLGTGGHTWLLDKAELDAALESTTRDATEAGGGWVSDEAWRHASVVRGRPEFGIDFGDFTYPQETGLTEPAVSFGKGCYIGQETVVMLQNRGKAPKLLWRWAIEGAEPPADKAPILKEGAVVGEITSAAAVDGETLALGFLKRGHEEEVEGFEVEGRPARPVGPVSGAPGVGAARR